MALLAATRQVTHVWRLALIVKRLVPVVASMVVAMVDATRRPLTQVSGRRLLLKLVVGASAVTSMVVATRRRPMLGLPAVLPSHLSQVLGRWTSLHLVVEAACYPMLRL